MIHACRSKLAITPTQVAEEFELVYPTAQALLFELALERARLHIYKHNSAVERSGQVMRSVNGWDFLRV